MVLTGIDPAVWRHHAWRNRLQSLALLAAMGGFLALLGWLLWGDEGVVMLLAVGVAGVLIHPTLSPRLVMRLYGAAPVSPRRVPSLWAVLSRLAERAGLPAVPQLYYVPSLVVNAFAVGRRRRAVVAVTDGLLRQLDLRELAGVLAHEISHVRNDDLWIMGLADTFSRTTSLLSLVGQFLLLLNLPLLLFSAATVNWYAIALLILAPNVSGLAQLALSRTREYDADLDAARLTGDPDGLANALLKIEGAQGGWWERVLMPGRRVPVPSLLRTHPETRERIDRLMALKPRLEKSGDLPLGGPFDPPSGLGRPAGPPRRRFHGLWY